MNACSSEHSSCQPRGRSLLPTRVIDVAEFGKTPSLFTSNGQCGQWVALSYCWGNVLPLRTVSSNLESLQMGISLELLPLLFQDTITVVRRLGYRYLWIDALCIVQDSEMDWVKESAKMGGIFQNASLTILAESAEDSSLGLLSVMEKERQVPSILIQAHTMKGGVRGRLRAGIDPSSCKGPLARRAWTLQEELLSPCVIRFTRSQVWWQCREAFRCETYPKSLDEDPDRQNWHRVGFKSLTPQLKKFLFQPHHHTHRRLKPTHLKDIFSAISSKSSNVSFKLHHRDTLRSLSKSWYLAIVNVYTSRKITYVKDTFPAISGIARFYCRHGLQDYKAGLWLQDMHQGLLWTTSGTGRKTKAPYIAPSWSWASMDLGGSEMTYNASMIDRFVGSPLIQVARIERINVALLSEDPFGQIKAANLVMTGPGRRVCRNDIPGGFMDIDNAVSEDRRFYRYSLLNWARDVEEWSLPWSRRKTANCNIWTVESVTRKSPHLLQHPCLLLHVASHKFIDEDGLRYAFCLILEAVSDEEVGALVQSESKVTKEHHTRYKAEKAKKRDIQTQHLDTEPGEKPVQYRRIGLAILQETVPTHTIWSEKTVTII
jgi:hypothetical protein